MGSPRRQGNLNSPLSKQRSQPMSASQFSIQRVVAEGFCVGCGACRASSQGATNMTENAYGLFVPDLSRLSQSQLADADLVCPFSNASANEDVVGKELFEGQGGQHDVRLGHYQSLHAGRILAEDRIENSSSGGLTTWLAAELIRTGEVDGVIHVGENRSSSSRLFDYSYSESVAEIWSKTKSRYYTVEFSEVLLKIRGNGRRYLFIGLPCFVKAIRLLCRTDAEIKTQIPYCFALVCGHLKTPAFAELLAWQLGTPPNALQRFDFRVKDSSKPASKYAVGAWQGAQPSPTVKSAHELYGSNWGHAFFQLKACDACDDVMGELADATLGDAWLPQYEAEWRGTNIVISRSPLLTKLLRQGQQNASIFLENISEADVVASQDGNYRHRWDGLSLRALDAKRKGVWFPNKRIAPGSRRVDFFRAQIIRLRQKISSKSHLAFLEAKQGGNLDDFLRQLRPLTDKMREIQNWAYRLNRERLVKIVTRPDLVLKKLITLISRAF